MKDQFLPCKKTLVWGGGSCLRVLAPMLESIGRRADFVFSDPSDIAAVECLTPDLRPDILEAASQCDRYVISIGGSNGKRRHELSLLFQHEYKLGPISLVHHTSYICPSANVDSPIFVMPNVVIHSGAKISRDCIVNTSAVVEHECMVSEGVHIMGSAVLTGRCTVRSYSTIGTNSASWQALAYLASADAFALIHSSVGMSSPIVMTARHLANLAPNL